MPKATKLSNFMDIDSEDEFARDDQVMLTPDSAVENTKTKGRKATTTGRVTKAKTAATVKKAPSNTKAKRAVLVEKEASATETEDDDMKRRRNKEDVEEEADTDKKPAKRGRPARAKETAPAQVAEKKPRKNAKAAKATTEEELVSELLEEPVSKPTKTTTTKKSKAIKRAPSPEPAKVIPETQSQPVEITETSEVLLGQDEDDEPTPKPAPVPRPAPARATSRSGSRQRAPFKRAPSASDTERASDPALRRKLGDITRQLENVQIKYNNLREVGTRDAESNFDKLRRTTEAKAKAQDDIITNLKKELAHQKALAAETKTLRSQLASQMAEVTRLTSENASLTKQLSEAQTENKNLSAKLSAARAASAQPAQPPGSAMKPSRSDTKKAAAPVSEEVSLLKLKEELYADLTGLILNGVKRLDGEDVYDCIQTGRNGTLHFHLSISHPTTSNSADYADAEFAYTPLLDERNDRDLIDVLPDYLTEEICFPRSSAAKFYGKVVECMGRRVVVDEE